MLPSQSQPLHFSLLQEKTRTITSFLCMQLPHLPTQVKKHNSENPKSQFFQKSQSSRPTIHKKTDIFTFNWLQMTNLALKFCVIYLFLNPVFIFRHFLIYFSKVLWRTADTKLDGYKAVILMNFVLAHSVAAHSSVQTTMIFLLQYEPIPRTHQKMLPEMQGIRNVIRVTNVVPKNSTLLNKAHSKFPVISSFGGDRPET